MRREHGRPEYRRKDSRHGRRPCTKERPDIDRTRKERPPRGIVSRHPRLHETPLERLERTGTLRVDGQWPAGRTSRDVPKRALDAVRAERAQIQAWERASKHKLERAKRHAKKEQEFLRVARAENEKMRKVVDERTPVEVRKRCARFNTTVAVRRFDKHAPASTVKYGHNSTKALKKSKEYDSKP